MMQKASEESEHEPRFLGMSAIKALRATQAISVIAVLLIATIIVVNNQQQRAAVVAQVREQNRLKLRAAKVQTEDYIGEMRLCLKLISGNPDVRKMSRASQPYLQAIYEANFAQHHVPEIYVIEREFDGTTRPFMSFERGDDERDVEELHALEREAEEYAVQIEHIRKYVASPGLRFLMTGSVPLCVGEPGLVLSAPIRPGADLVGIVAAMIPSRLISAVLESSSLQNMVLLTNTRGEMFYCADFDDTVKPWFETRFAEEGVSKFFESRQARFQIGDYTALWMPVNLADDDPWYVTLVYDESAARIASGVAGVWSGWGEAATVLLLGGVVVFLCRVSGELLVARYQAAMRRRALAESEALTGAAVDGIITMDEDGVVQSMNAAAVQIFGYPTDQVIGHDVKMLMPLPCGEVRDDDSSWFLVRGEEERVGGTREVVGCRQDGSSVPVEVAVSEVRLPGKRLFTAVVRDITERKRTQEALRESEGRLKAILNNTTRVVYLKDLEGRYLLVNRRFEELFHLSQAEAIGNTAPDIMPPELSERLYDHDRQVLREMKAKEFEETVPLDDGLHTFATIKFPLFDGDGEPYAVCGISADVTKQKQVEKEVEQRREELAHVTRLATMGEMAAGLAHELNQPLAAVVTYLQAARERVRGGSAAPEELLHDIEHANTQAHMAGEIIHQMRKFVRKADTKRERIDVNTLVRESSDFADHLATSGRIDVRLELDHDAPTVIARRTQIQQVILNLIRNGMEAMSHMEDHRRRLVIRTSHDGGREVEISVQDFGTGICHEAMKRIFEPFYTTKPDGMGMGLSISRSIIQQHDGRLWGESNNGQGSTFRFTLPANAEDLVG